MHVLWWRLTAWNLPWCTRNNHDRHDSSVWMVFVWTIDTILETSIVCQPSLCLCPDAIHRSLLEKHQLRFPLYVDAKQTISFRQWRIPIGQLNTNCQNETRNWTRRRWRKRKQCYCTISHRYVKYSWVEWWVNYVVHVFVNVIPDVTCSKNNEKREKRARWHNLQNNSNVFRVDTAHG